MVGGNTLLTLGYEFVSNIPMGMTDTIPLEVGEAAPETQRPEAAENRARAWLSRQLAWETRLEALHDEGHENRAVTAASALFRIVD